MMTRDNTFQNDLSSTEKMRLNLVQTGCGYNKTLKRKTNRGPRLLRFLESGSGKGKRK